MSRLIEMLCLSSAIVSTIAFIYVALKIMTSLEKNISLWKEKHWLCLAGIIITSLCMINAPDCENKGSNICSIGILLVIAIIDETTGYIYDGWNYVLLLFCMIFALTKWPTWLTEREVRTIFIYLVFVVLMGLIHGIGIGDVPVFLALILFYLRTTNFPADAVVCLLILSIGLGVLNCLVQRKKWLPLAPSIWMAHLITICVWGN